MAVHGTCFFGGKVQNVFVYYGERNGGRERGRKGKIRNGIVFLIQILLYVMGNLRVVVRIDDVRGLCFFEPSESGFKCV